MITFEQAAKVDAVVRECFDKANTFFNASMAYPTVEWTTHKSTTAGKAYSSRNLITLNAAMFLENEEDYYKNTIPHECAHIIANKHWNTRCNHNHRWKYVMHMLGADSSRCHEYDTTNHKRDVRKYEYTCACPGKVFNISTIRHRRAQQGQIYTCTKCRTKIVYKHTNTAPIQRTYEQPKTYGAYAQTAGTTTQPGSKMDRACQLFQQYSNQPRHVIIDMFINHVGLTPAGANTYYYNIKKEFMNV